ncbi:MAG: isoprenoid biosynthesis glyoxalase ElbB, partial [Opitutales bacterium]
MKKVAVILSGCGVYDGSEIYESVLTLRALEQSGAEITCAAPDIAQKHVIDHSSGKVDEGAQRNVLQEAARVARGKITPLDDLNAGSFDAIFFVGGFGVAKNLSSFAFDGQDYDVDPGVSDFIKSAHSAGKPLGF